MKRSRLSLLLSTAAMACSDPSVQQPPLMFSTGPAPSVQATIGFGDAPLVGQLRVVPDEDATDWAYAIDFDADGASDRSGIAIAAVNFDYTFETPGVHPIRIDFRRGPEQVEVESLVVVNDPGAIEILVQRSLPFFEDPESGTPIYEGIAADHAGEAIYVGDFRLGIVYRIDANTLEDLALPLKIDSQIEGLAVVPSDSLLLVARKNRAASIIAIPTMEERRRVDAIAFFVEPLSDSEALFGGQENMVILDPASGDEIVRGEGAWHFSVSPTDPARIAALEDDLSPTVSFFSLPDLILSGRTDIPELETLETVEFDPSGDVLYAMGFDGERNAILMIDAATGGELMRWRIAGSVDCRLCAANPTAVSFDGRYVAFEGTLPGLIIIDTEIGAPRFKPMNFIGGAVAASSVDPSVFYAVRSDGLVVKLRVREPRS